MGSHQFHKQISGLKRREAEYSLGFLGSQVIQEVSEIVLYLCAKLSFLCASVHT